MNRIKVSWVLALLLAICIPAMIIFSACAQAKPAAPVTDASGKQVYKARFAYHWPSNQQPAIYAEKFAHLCNSETNGRLEIKTYPASSLYNIVDAVGAVSQGSVEMTAVVESVLVGINPNYGISSQIYLFSSYEQLYKMWDSKPGRAVIKAVQDKLGITYICHDPIGPAYAWTTDKPLRTLDDFKGLKARMLSVAEKPALEAYGMSGVSVQTAEVYQALQQHMISYIATNPSAAKSNSWLQFLKYCATPPMSVGDAYIVVNTTWFKGLPTDIQDIVINKVGPKITTEATTEIIKASQEVLDNFIKSGGTITKMSPEDMAMIMKINREKVYPLASGKFDPELWNTALEISGQK